MGLGKVRRGTVLQGGGMRSEPFGLDHPSVDESLMWSYSWPEGEVSIWINAWHLFVCKIAGVGRHEDGVPAFTLEPIHRQPSKINAAFRM